MMKRIRWCGRKHNAGPHIQGIPQKNGFLEKERRKWWKNTANVREKLSPFW
jgi:hypothetical protein